MKSTTRTKLGPHFSEASRLLWRVVEGTYESIQVRAAAGLGIQPAQLSRWLYGDAVPGSRLMFKLQEGAGINPALWNARPRKPFVLPAARKAA